MRDSTVVLSAMLLVVVVFVVDRCSEVPTPAEMSGVVECRDACAPSRLRAWSSRPPRAECGESALESP